MKIIGVTGPSGSGKSAFSDLLRDTGIYVIDADEVYHSLLVPPSECLAEISKSFGKEIFNADGTLSRAGLGEIVFADPNKLSLLNSITHKYVISKMRYLLDSRKKAGDKLAAIDVPLLFESSSDKLCKVDLSVAILANLETRISRIISRDKISEEAAMKRIAAQPSDDFYISHANKVIYNNGSKDELRNAMNSVLKELKYE